MIDQVNQHTQQVNELAQGLQSLGGFQTPYYRGYSQSARRTRGRGRNFRSRSASIGRPPMTRQASSSEEGNYHPFYTINLAH